MINRRVAAVVVLVLLLSPSGLLGGIMFVSKYVQMICNGKTYHKITFQETTSFANGVQSTTFSIISDVDTGLKCCNTSAASNAIRGPQPHDDSDVCSPSTPQSEGGTETNPGTLASVTNSGGGSAPSGGSPPVAVTAPMASRRVSAPISHQTSPSGKTAYTPTLPFLPFAIPPLTFGSTPPTLTAAECNAQLNPTAYQVNHNVATVTRLNLCTGATVDTVNVTGNPLEIAVTPDGKWGVVTSFFNAITFINTDNDTVANVIQTDQNTFPFGIAISPDGTFALVANFNNVDMDLVVVDLQTQTITGQIPLPYTYPQSVFLSPDGTLAWVTYPFENIVQVIDVMTGDIVSSISVEEPLDVVFNATGTVAYIASETPGSVAVVNTASYKVVANIPTAAGTDDLMLSPDGLILTMNNYFGGSIGAIDTTALTNILTAPVTAAPFGVAPVPFQ